MHGQTFGKFASGSLVVPQIMSERYKTIQWKELKQGALPLIAGGLAHWARS